MTNKEKIELLKKIQKDAEAIERNSKAKGETAGKAREILAIQIELHCDQALSALKAEPKVNLWFVRDYLKSALNRWGLDDAKYWVEQALCELEQPKCKTCGGSGKVPSEYGLTQCSSLPISPFNTKPCPDCGYKQIELMGGKYAIVDIGDFERVNKYKWRLDENGRATRNMWDKGKQRNIKMHRFIMDAPEGMCVDHINYDTLDNRKSNLRICTPSQSSAHRKAFPNTSSKYKGVSKRSNCNKWQAHIKQNYKGMYLGDYDTEEEAARVYDKKAKELFGEYAELNFPPDCPPKGDTGLRPIEKAGEFTKEARRQLDIGVNVLDGFLREACDKLDSQDKRLELLLFNRNELFDETVKLKAELDKAKERIEENRWIPADEPPEKIDNWDKKVLVLECDSEIPITMTMAEVFLDEGSDAEYWKPIVLP